MFNTQNVSLPIILLLLLLSVLFKLFMPAVSVRGRYSRTMCYCAPLPTNTFIARNQPLGEYPHHRNEQTLQISSPFPSLQVKPSLGHYCS